MKLKGWPKSSCGNQDKINLLTVNLLGRNMFQQERLQVLEAKLQLLQIKEDMKKLKEEFDKRFDYYVELMLKTEGQIYEIEQLLDDANQP